METDKTQGNSDTAKVTYDRNIKVAIVIGSFALFALIWLPTFFTVFTERVPEARADEVAVSDIDEAEIEVAVLRTGEGRRAGVGDVVRLNFIQQIGDEVIDTTYPTGSHPSGRGPVPHLLGTNDGSGNELFALIQAAFNKALDGAQVGGVYTASIPAEQFIAIIPPELQDQLSDEERENIDESVNFTLSVVEIIPDQN